MGKSWRRRESDAKHDESEENEERENFESIVLIERESSLQILKISMIVISIVNL
jgi:hypothetical protein